MNTPKEAVILGLVGAGGLAFALAQIKKSFDLRHWQRTTGRVVTSELRRTEVLSDGDANIDILVTFTYHANGQTHTGTRLGLYTELFHHRKMATASAHLKRVAPGTEIPVWFDPANPSEAIADKAVPSGFWIIAALGLLFVVGAVTTMLRAPSVPVQ